ncbi:serpin family protein [Sorangium sp. So ce176]|uniref:serpin family protein n=1 Tax=Sorangium sp. So ce176 TaxID=3133286 RepID=UPI003F5FB80B
MRRPSIPVALLPLSLLVAGCAPRSAEPEPQPSPSVCGDADTAGCLVTSNKPRDREPAVPEADAKALVAGNTAFALDLYRRVSAWSSNLIYSPYSVSSALAMTYAGARGETEAQMMRALRFTLPQERLHPAFNALDLALASRGEGAEGQDGEGFRLNVANALWAQVGSSFAPSFLDVLAESYGAGLHVVDFAQAPDEARGIINGWVAERTEDRIKDILPAGAIQPATRLILTNAVYFNAAWQFPFDEDDTAPGDFSLMDGTSVSVPMMSNSAQVRHGEGDDFEALELPYDGGELSMVLVLPSAGGARFLDIDPEWLEGVFASLETRSVTMTLPRFKFESSLDLVDPLVQLGMPLAFTGLADFSGIDGQGGLFISDVLHKAFISVNEAGTEAAAATAVVIGETSAPEPATIHFDRPFLFFIRDTATGAILFVGRVMEPSR